MDRTNQLITSFWLRQFQLDHLDATHLINLINQYVSLPQAYGASLDRDSPKSRRHIQIIACLINLTDPRFSLFVNRSVVRTNRLRELDYVTHFNVIQKQPNHEAALASLNKKLVITDLKTGEVAEQIDFEESYRTSNYIKEGMIDEKTITIAASSSGLYILDCESKETQNVMGGSFSPMEANLARDAYVHVGRITNDCICVVRFLVVDAILSRIYLVRRPFRSNDIEEIGSYELGIERLDRGGVLGWNGNVVVYSNQYHSAMRSFKLMFWVYDMTEREWSNTQVDLLWIDKRVATGVMVVREQLVVILSDGGRYTNYVWREQQREWFVCAHAVSEPEFGAGWFPV